LSLWESLNGPILDCRKHCRLWEYARNENVGMLSPY
jgi:hypothetical protein